MIFLYIILGVLALAILIIITPLKVELRYEINTNFDKSNNLEQLNTVNYINLYILNFIKIKKFKMDNKENEKEKNNSPSGKKVFDIIAKFLIQYIKYEKLDQALLSTKEIKRLKSSLYYEKIDLNIGVNFKDVVLNSYIISLLNALINMYFAKNADKINFSKASYITYISNKIINIKINSIIKVKLVNTIGIIIKLIISFRKVVKKDGRTTSNRKLNANSYDFA